MAGRRKKNVWKINGLKMREKKGKLPYMHTWVFGRVINKIMCKLSSLKALVPCQQIGGRKE